MKLRSKFHLASTFLVLLVILGVMVSLYFSEKNRLVTDTETEQNADLDKLARVYQEFRFIDQETIFLNYVQKTLIENPKVSYAGFVEADGTGWLYSKTREGLVFNDPADKEIQALLDSKRSIKRDLVFNKEAITEVARPVNSRSFVRLGYSRNVLRTLFSQNMNRLVNRLTIVGLIAMVFGLFLSSLFAAALSRPIKLLMEGAEAIARGKKGVKLPVKGKDELSRLTTTFNHMSEQLAKLDELKDDFMSHVSHELRSPLTSIIATIELMADMPLAAKDPKMKRSVDRLMYGAERLNRLVDNILDLTRMQAGKMHFDIKPVDMGSILIEMADFFETRAEEKALTIKAALPKSLPLAMADPEKIRQVISNLVHNAIKFTNQGGVTLRAAEKDGMIQISIEDTGVGIPADKLGTIFEKFETLQITKDKVNKPVPGSGLGLNIVQNSIRAQGGKIWVESKEDEGSIFTFTLPLAPKNAVTEKPARRPFVIVEEQKVV